MCRVNLVKQTPLFPSPLAGRGQGEGRKPRTPDQAHLTHAASCSLSLGERVGVRVFRATNEELRKAPSRARNRLQQNRPRPVRIHAQVHRSLGQPQVRILVTRPHVYDHRIVRSPANRALPPVQTNACLPRVVRGLNQFDRPHPGGQVNPYRRRALAIHGPQVSPLPPRSQ